MPKNSQINTVEIDQIHMKSLVYNQQAISNQHVKNVDYLISSTDTNDSHFQGKRSPYTSVI